MATQIPRWTASNTRLASPPHLPFAPVHLRTFTTSPEPLVSRKRILRSTPHPSTPTFHPSPSSPSSPPTTARLRKRILNLVSKPRSAHLQHLYIHEKNILKRRDGISGKKSHSLNLPLAQKQHAKEMEEEKRRVMRDRAYLVSKTLQAQRQAEEQQHRNRNKDGDGDERASSGKDDPAEELVKQLDEWEFPSKSWNRASPRAVDTYRVPQPPPYSPEQRAALGTIRKFSLLYEYRKREKDHWEALTEEQREERVKDGKGPPKGVSEEEWESEGWKEYERGGWRSPMYDFFRGGVTIHPRAEVVNFTGQAWEPEHLSRKSFSDLHTLWYLLLRERNLLLASLHALRSSHTLPSPLHLHSVPLLTRALTARILKCRVSMRNIKKVLGRRGKAVRELAERKRVQFGGSDGTRMYQWALAREELAWAKARESASSYASNPSLIDASSPPPSPSESDADKLARQEAFLRSILETTHAQTLSWCDTTPEGKAAVEKVLKKKGVKGEELVGCMESWARALVGERRGIEASVVTPPPPTIAPKRFVEGSASGSGLPALSA